MMCRDVQSRTFRAFARIAAAKQLLFSTQLLPSRLIFLETGTVLELWQVQQGQVVGF